MRRTGMVVLACVSWLGCAPEETFRSGSRLQLQWLTAEGGARIFDGFFDAELETRCVPSRMADGVVRCVPVRNQGALTAVLGPVGTFERYLDDQCTQPIVPWSASSCSEDVRLLTRTEGEGCARVDEVYELGEVVPSSSQAFMRVGSSCTPDIYPLDQSEVRRLVPFDRAKLLEFSETKVDLGRLEALLGRGKDGASVLLQLRDRTSGNLCTPSSLDALSSIDGPAACLPTTVGSLGGWWHFTGPTCSTPAVQSFIGPVCDGSSASTPKVARLLEQDAECRVTRSEFYELGARVEEPYRQGATCEPNGAPAIVYEVGKKLEPSSFPEVDVAVTGTTLKTTTWQVNGRTLALPRHFWLDGEPCLVTHFADDTRRCVPSTALAVGDAYFDDACTRLAFRAFELSSCQSPAYLLKTERLSCSSWVTKVFRTGRQVTAEKLYARQGTTCVEWVSAPVTAWEVGEEVSADVFPRVSAPRP